MSQDDFIRQPATDPGLEAELLPKLRRICNGHLGRILQQVYRLTDEAQFKLSQADEVSFGSKNLESLRMLRAAINPLEQAFLRHFDAKFDALMDRFRRDSANAGEPAEMNLVEIEDMEDIVASELIAESLIRAFEPKLNAFERRLARLLRVEKLAPSENPVSTASIADAMRVGLQGQLLGPNVRILLFKFYERELAGHLGDMFDEANTLMLEAGIMPELGKPRPPPRPRMQSKPASVSDPMAGTTGEASASQFDSPPPAEDAALFETIRNLLSGWRPQQGGDGGGASGGGGGGNGGGAGGFGGGGQGNSATAQDSARRPLAVGELVSVLSLMQGQVPASVHEAISRPESSLSVMLKEEMLGRADSMGMNRDKVKMGRDDEDAVDLVGMLFDVLFDERDFQAQGRTLISRLVVPYVKAAVMDRRLFQYKTHPARRLLNSVAEAVEGNKGEAVQERELLDKAEQTVDRLLAEFNEDLAIFETLEQELRSFLEQHRRRAELAERRASEAQSGQERLEQARALSATALARRLEHQVLPDVLTDFLARHWAHHMSMIALREGADSPAWSAGVTAADQLVALLPREGHQPPQVPTTLSDVRPVLESVLANSGVFGDAANDVIQSLALALESAQQQPPPPAAPAETALPHGERRLRPREGGADGADSPLLSIVSDRDRLDYEEEDARLIRGMIMGTWIDLAGEDGKLQPAKLTWVSPISSRLMFVNRRGVRMLVASIEELAAMKKAGKLTLRNQEQAFDLALHRVMSRLQETEKTRAE